MNKVEARKQGAVALREDWDRDTEDSPNRELELNVFRYPFTKNFLIENEWNALQNVLELGSYVAVTIFPHMSLSSVRIQTGYKETRNVFKSGCFNLIYQSWTFTILVGEATDGKNSITVFCSDPLGLSWFESTFSKYRLVDNMYKGKAFRLTGDGVIFVHPKESSYENLVLNPLIKQSIYDQSVFFLEKMKGMNGVILHGEPGTGKSYTSASIAYECIKLGITVITLYNINSFFMLFIKEFINSYCDRCLICIEDVDSAAESRDYKDTHDSLAPLLEFMDGFESNADISCVVFATTNHLDRLDKAVGNRPCRFNRKIKFDYLTDDQTTIILNRLFKNTLNENQLALFKDKEGLTPSHLAEIYRTAQIMALKESNESYSEYFNDATQEVLDSFTPTLSSNPVGFKDTPY